MDLRSAIVPALHTVLAAALAILAILGLFGSRAVDVQVVGDARFAWLIVLPLVGIVMLGLYDWQNGRSTWMLRAADLAAFVLATIELSFGTIGFARWLAGTVALLAAGGIAASMLVKRPRRAGFRR